MKSFIYLSALVCLMISGCSSNPSSGSGNNAATGVSVAPGSNVMSITMGCGYVNEPCVSVTICVPGTSNCQTINNVLLDTGSYGLRLFSSTIGIGLTQETNSGGAGLAECVSYADGSSQWGPVAVADVQLGSETAPNVPIEIINSTYATPPSGCTDLDSSPSQAGFNGILGVGLFTQDCGATCVTSASSQVYYACTGTSCTGSTAALSAQVTNPVALLPVDKNGVVLVLPSIGSGGASNVSGAMILGIGTQTNNTPSGVSVFTANGNGEFRTTYGSHQYSAFIDSGSNGMYFPSSSITQCTGNDAGFYCPSSTLAATATQISNSGGTQASVSFSIANADALLNTNSTTLNNLGGYMSGSFDWGLPFFLGRSVYVGIEGTSSSLGTGPYWAY